jgi:hypothetical protein
MTGTTLTTSASFFRTTMSIWRVSYARTGCLAEGKAYRLERVARGVDKEQAAVDARVGDVALAQGGQLFAEVRRVLILDLAISIRAKRVVLVD